MKRSLLLIAAALVVLCFAQCTKQRPDSPHYSGKVGDMYIQHISVEASRGGNSNSKVSVENGEIDADLTLKWEDKDKIYVYDGSKLCGILDFVNWTSEDHKSAKFESNSSTPIATTVGAPLSFYYFGSALTPQAGTYNKTATFTVDLSTQNGSLESIKNNLVLKSIEGVTFTPGQESYNLTMEVPYSIIKFDLSNFGTNANYGNKDYDLTVSNVDKKGFTITNGNLTEDNFAKLGSMTFKKVKGSNQYYVAMMAGDDQNLQFTTTKISVNRKISLAKSKFYTDDYFTGNGVVLAKVETVAPCGIHTHVASSGGKVTNGIGVTKQGICWSENSKPTIADNVYYHNYDYRDDISKYLTVSGGYEYADISDSRWTTKSGSVDNTFTGFMSNLKENTTYYVRAFVIFGKTVLYDEGEQTFKTRESEPTITEVDLGLPSGKIWATCNLGATSPLEYGDYYMWGDNAACTTTTGPTVNCHEFQAYCYSVDNRSKFIKYYKEDYAFVSGTTDYKYELDPSDDCVRQTLGGQWRLPTKDEWQELHDGSDVSWTTNYNGTGVKGLLFTSKKNSNTLFLSAAGIRSGETIVHTSSNGRYWSSSLNTDKTKEAHTMYFDVSYCNPQSYNDRFYGLTVRAVRDAK